MPPPGTDEVMPTPGATSEIQLATFAKAGTRSVSVVAETETVFEIQAGAPVASRNPSLPVEATVAMPTEKRLSIAAFNAACSVLQVVRLV